MAVNYERIALWVIVIVMFIKLFVIREFYTPSSPLSIMDLAEFRGLPDDLKQIWQTNIVNTIMAHSVQSLHRRGRVFLHQTNKFLQPRLQQLRLRLRQTYRTLLLLLIPRK